MTFFQAMDGPKTTLRNLASHRSDAYQGSLDKIIERRFLRVLTTPNSFNYFVHNGKESGFEYEMVKAFVSYLNRELNINEKSLQIAFEMIPVPPDQLFALLEKGHADMIAAGITKTPGRSQRAEFSIGYNRVAEVIVHHPSQELKNIKDLSGKAIHVRKSSSYFESLARLNVELTQMGLKPANVIPVDEHLDTESILELVSLNKYRITVADSHIADIAEKVFDNLVVNHAIVVREQGDISWATAKGANDLLEKINGFLPGYKMGSLHGNINLKKYFKNISRVKSRYFSKENAKISPHDHLFKKYGTQYGWDWRLLAALAYQESRFEQDIENKWGAVGIMQIKRFVANEPYIGIKNITELDNNIHAGVKYLSWLRDTHFNSPEISTKHRIRLSLAAYNAGPGRVAQARKRAVKMKLNPNKWFREVEFAMLAMDKTEPVNYVSSINRLALAYAIMGIPERAVAPERVHCVLPDKDQSLLRSPAHQDILGTSFLRYHPTTMSGSSFNKCP